MDDNIRKFIYNCDWACKNQPCVCKKLPLGSIITSYPFMLRLQNIAECNEYSSAICSTGILHSEMKTLAKCT